jgi:hypothetical protein
MIISDLLLRIRERNRLLYYAGLLNVMISLAFVVLSQLDHREVMGINTWIKPMKFSLSFIIFLWTFAWILSYLPDRKKIQWISVGLVVCMLMETITISLQAARGETSHYNTSSLFNIVIFQIMGLFIFLNTLIVAYIIFLFFKPTVRLDDGMKLAIQGGLIVFFLGSLSGGIMVGNGAHSIGSADGGEGLFFLNWSTAAGDLRAAHFFSLHALQFIPLAVWLVSLKTGKSKLLSAAVILVYSAFCVFLHAQAISGTPFFAG